MNIRNWGGGSSNKVHAEQSWGHVNMERMLSSQHSKRETWGPLSKLANYINLNEKLWNRMRPYLNIKGGEWSRKTSTSVLHIHAHMHAHTRTHSQLHMCAYICTSTLYTCICTPSKKKQIWIPTITYAFSLGPKTLSTEHVIHGLCRGFTEFLFSSGQEWVFRRETW